MFQFSLKMTDNKKTQTQIDFKRQTLTNITHQNELQFLQKDCTILLGKIQIQEDRINYLEKHSKLYLKDINDLQQMILTFFRILALIDAYQFFQSQNLMLTDENMDRFLFVFNSDYSIRITKFINDLIAFVKKTK